VVVRLHPSASRLSNSRGM